MQQKITKINRIVIGDSLRRTARRYPNKVAIVDGSLRITYNQFERKTNQVAHYLVDKGFEKGERIATICVNSSEHILAMYGIAKSGCVWIPINVSLLTTDFEFILQESKVKLVIVDEQIYKEHFGLLKDYECLIVSKRERQDGFLKAIAHASEEELDVEIEDRDVSQIMYTSGTTSKPKGVMISHVGVHLAALNALLELRMDSSLSTIGMLPYYHCADHTFLHQTFTVGGQVTVVNGFDVDEVLDIIQNEKVTATYLLPMMYREIFTHPKIDTYDLSTLDRCLFSMAPMEKDIMKAAIEKYGVEFILISGQTEMFPPTVYFRANKYPDKVGSYWGEPTPANELDIMDEEGNFLPKGEIGEIVHRGPNVMIGYLNNEESTEYAQKFGWHHTGDLGYIDEDDQLVFVDRKKDLIKTGGENVASIHIEEVLVNSEHIAQIAVVGLPHPRWIEAVTAFVVPTKGATEEIIRDYCRTHLANFQIPKKIILVDELPMTTTGKIQKHHIRKEYMTIYESDS